MSMERFVDGPNAGPSTESSLHEEILLHFHTKRPWRKRIPPRSTVFESKWGQWEKKLERHAADSGSSICTNCESIYWAVQWSCFARVNALCNLLGKKSREVAASFPGRFLSRRCFTLCITVEVEPRITKQYKCQYCCSYKNYRRKGMEGGKKVSLRHFLADQKIASS